MRRRAICGGCSLDTFFDVDANGHAACPDCGWRGRVTMRGPHVPFRARIDLTRAVELYHGQTLGFDIVAEHLGVSPTALARAFRRAGIVVRDRNAWRRGALQTHCKRGHELEGDNVYLYTDGRRTCRTCLLHRGRVNQRARRARLRLEAST